MIDKDSLALCAMQGRLFEKSGEIGYDSESFIKTFMNSPVAKDLDKPFSFMHWCGGAYILDRLEEECGDKLFRGGTVYGTETLHWIGYLYRYWHYDKEEDSRSIVRQAPPEFLRSAYTMYHTMTPELAIERLKESYLDRKHIRRPRVG